MKKMQNGPLAGLKDRSQIRDFVQKCTQLYKNRKLQTDQLDKLTQLTESTVDTDFGKEISLDITKSWVQNDQVMFDIAKHQLSQHVPVSYTKHLAVGNNAINLLLANEEDPQKPFSNALMVQSNSQNNKQEDDLDNEADYLEGYEEA